MITVNKASVDDMPRILEIYAIARNFMKRSGNDKQWGSNYPSEHIIRDDISKGQLFVIKDESGSIAGVFSFIIGIDTTYENINGMWHSDAKYGTIHRLASCGKMKGIFSAVLSFCKHNAKYLRIDTHEDNKVMQHLLEKSGFSVCGTIYVHDKTPRIAYDMIVLS